MPTRSLVRSAFILAVALAASLSRPGSARPFTISVTPLQSLTDSGAASTATCRATTASASSIASNASRQDVQSPVSRLRALFFHRDFETAIIEGAKLASDAGTASELKAWYLLNLARAGRADEAVMTARQLTEKASGDAWAWFALAGALNYQAEDRKGAIDAAARAFELMPNNDDAAWIRAQTLANDPGRRDEAIAFVDSQRAKVVNPAEILVTKAYALYQLAYGPPRDETKTEAAFRVFEEARQADPGNVNALYLNASYLSSVGRSDEALPLLEKALALSPAAVSLHQEYWSAISASRTQTAEQKRERIMTDLKAFLAEHGNRPATLLACASRARDLQAIKERDDAEEGILREFNDTPQAEWVLVNRWRALPRGPETPKMPEYRRMLQEYIARPKHYHLGLLGEAYRELFSILAVDEQTTADALKPVLQGMVKYETTNTHITHVLLMMQLADRKMLLDEAEQVARDGIAVLRTKVEGRRSSYKTQGEFEQALNSNVALGHDALGWVLFAKGQMEEAEKELLRSYDLNHESRDNLHHLGRFYEARNDIARAEEFYIKGLGAQRPGPNPCEASLRALYEKRTGGGAGFDKYLAELRDLDRVRRKERILGERLAEPEAVPAFNLKGLDGTRVSLESLRGKIVVINFWGIWCGWCVRELPDYQKLFEQYAKDPSVAILTIDNDSNPDDVPPWMREKGFTFPVLIDDGYVSKAGIQAFPTTWFLDAEGRKVFSKRGWSEKLLEEFAWRIEAIRAGGSTAAPYPSTQLR